MRKFPAVAALAAAPLCCLIFPFACGFFNFDPVALMLMVPLMVFAPPLTTVLFAFIARVESFWKSAAICVALYAVVFGVFVLAPPGAAAWTIGFAYNMRVTKNPRAIQAWAVEVIDRYKRGTLKTEVETKYRGSESRTIATNEIPHHIQKRWKRKPEVVISTNSDHITFQWYLTGVYVGAPEFKPTSNPWFLYEVIPGVYAYSGYK